MENFRYALNEKRTQLTCSLEKSRFDATLTANFKESMDSAWKPTIRSVILDFKKVEFIDSSGIGALLSLQKKLPEDAEPLTLIHVDKSVAEVIELLRLHRVFNLNTTDS